MTYFISILSIISGLLLTGSVSYVLAPKTDIQPTVTPTPIIKEEFVLGVETDSLSPTKIPVKPIFTPTLTPTIIPTPQSNPTTIVIILTPTPLPSPTLTPTPIPTSTPTPIPSIVSLEIKEPGGEHTFNLNIQNGINACQLLEQAKLEGKVNGLTLDDRYLSSFGTLLVKEMNGLYDNWVFTVNGDSPNGCSLVTLNNQDSIVWTYLPN